MFTGIIEEIGIVKNISTAGKSMTIEIKAEKVTENLNTGDSIALNGVCLTVSQFSSDSFKADVMPETFNKTNLKYLSISSEVNLESAMSFSKKFGGHIVQGHVDGTAVITKKEKCENAFIYSFSIDEKLSKYILKKGSVAIDGISLTVTESDKNSFSVSLIPLTRKSTALFNKKPGDTVNIECDIVGKYIEKFLSLKKSGENCENAINRDFLVENGFL